MKSRINTALLLIFLFLPVLSAQQNSKPLSQKKWKFETGDRIFSAPQIQNNIIYFGSNDDNFYSVDASSGKLKWKFKTGGNVNSSSAISDGVIYFGSGDGFYYALNIDDGTLKWKFKTNGEKMDDVWDYYLSTPVVKNDAVYFGSGDYNIYAVNKNNGEKIWSYKTEGIVHSSPAIKDELIFIGSFDGNLYALDINSGKLKWKFKTLGNMSFPDGAIQGSPSVEGDYLYFGSRDYNLYALNTETGKVMWNKSTPSWVIAKPVLHENFLYYGNSESPKLFARTGKYGSLRWEYEVNANVFADAVPYGGDILFGCFNGKIYAINKESGELSYFIQTDASKEKYYTFFNEEDKIKPEIISSIKTMDDVIKVYEDLLNLGSVAATPLIHNNIIYVPSTDGSLYAFE